VEQTSHYVSVRETTSTVCGMKRIFN